MTNNFHDEDELELNALDRQVTEILLTGERLCAKDNNARNPWSPTILTTGGTLTYWKNKMRMVRNKNIQWSRLDRLRSNLDISDADHKSLCIRLTRENLRLARRAWREAKRASGNLREQFLTERAEEYAMKMRTDKATALKMIKKSEEQKQTFLRIREITGSKKEKNPLTQVEVLTDQLTKTTITSKDEMETAIMAQNQKHSRQALQTPFATNPSLAKAIDPLDSGNRIDDLLQGTFLDTVTDDDDINLNEIERQWILELRQRMNSVIDTHISTDDFKQYFKHRKEKTASSYSGRHMGHYKVIAEIASKDDTIAHIITTIINTSLITSRPLN
jgi:hypothetical protein